MAAMGKLGRITDSHSDRDRSRLENLLDFTQRAQDEHVVLDTFWDNASFLHLLEMTFPDKATNHYGSLADDLHLRIALIDPGFSFDDDSKWMDFCRKILLLIHQYGADRISKKDEELAVKAFIRKWSRSIQLSFTSYVEHWTNSCRSFLRGAILLKLHERKQRLLVS
jgi:hypothetical protein